MTIGICLVRFLPYLQFSCLA